MIHHDHLKRLNHHDHPLNHHKNPSSTPEKSTSDAPSCVAQRLQVGSWAFSAAPRSGAPRRGSGTALRGAAAGGAALLGQPVTKGELMTFSMVKNHRL